MTAEATTSETHYLTHSEASSATASSKHSAEMSVEEQYHLPTQAELDEAAELEVLDKDGKSLKFRSLWDRQEPTERRNIIVFIRHFFCGACQEYVRSLSSQMSAVGLYLRNPPSTLTIIGCGDPSLIREYITTTNCDFEVYADPTRALYNLLGMTCSFALGDKKPEYIKKSFLSTTLMGIWDHLIHPTISPGRQNQNGGEFIFVDGALKWCRRMRNTRDHAEIDELKNVLENQKETGDRDGKYAEVCRDSIALADVDEK